MSFEVLGFCLLIILLRVVDVSLGTLRIVSVVRGNRLAAVCLGFIEALIWVLAISKVTANLDQPAYLVAFALGFAIGNYTGLALEGRLAFGEQVIRIFTRAADRVLPELRQQDIRFTLFRGEGRDGAVDMLLLKVRRRETRRLLERIAKMDEKSFYIVDDISFASDARLHRRLAPGLFRLKRK